MIEAHDASGCPDEQSLKAMAADGPPFLFASECVVEVGFEFKLGEQAFKVTRLILRQEFEDRQRLLALPVHRLTGGACYFEAATD